MSKHWLEKFEDLKHQNKMWGEGMNLPENRDKLLFIFTDKSGYVAEVHLTWLQDKLNMPYPVTTVFSGFDEWAIKIMIPENALWENT